MRQFWSLAVAAALSCALAPAAARAEDPAKIKVGILLPLTGVFAAVAETEVQGAQLAIDVVNKRGGLDMPWGKVMVEGVVYDDEAKIDVGVRRFRYLVSEGVKAVGGQTFAPIINAINSIVSKEPLPYFPVGVAPKENFQKGRIAECTFAAAYTPWTVGYMAAQSSIKLLGKKRIYFLARSDAWGWGIRDGVYDAARDLGGEIVGYDEVSLGTGDFTTILQKVRASNADVFISAQFGADAVALLKQAHQMDLGKRMTIFNSFITNVVAKGLPPEALRDVYALHYFYHDLSGFADKQVAESAGEFTAMYRAKYQTPPDGYAAIAYVAYTEMLRGFEAAKSFDPLKVSAVLRANNGQFTSMKGPAQWREDHQAAYKYAAFLVKGKGKDEQKSEWDLFTVAGTLGGDEVMPTLKSLGY